ncbi:MAG: SAM-dependent methyltransferase [Candidatus Marinimicrobia bacterium]|nr:SAM-dependent methyltransferase [Candidatus Neomarinimicrobiota bacterium]
MIRSFKPFFSKGSFLELGSHEGSFTKHLMKYSNDVSCVEVSSEAIKKAKKLFKNKVFFYNSSFEELKLKKVYDNILLTHVLEHLDNPVYLLERINKEWLSKNGRLFIAVPNANAPSRQIAVKMGLIDFNAAVTKGEFDHGHRITYSFDTLEKDVKKAGLNIIIRSGVFFKALANFQWDQLLKTDIISKEYLEGCYHLGLQYPELCSSIILICEKGK